MWHLLYSICNSAVVIIVIIEEKLVALPVCSLFRPVATRCFQKNSVLTSSGSQNHSRLAQFRSEYRFTPCSV